MQNLTSKILCIFVTVGSYAPYAPCLSKPLLILVPMESACTHSY